MATPILELSDIRKNYYLGPVTVKALKGVNLVVNQGEMVAIVGASGGGKSTLMNIMGLLDRPTAGTYYIDGIDTATADDNDLSRLRNKKIGFVFQSYNLLDRVNVWDNVGVPLQYRGMPSGAIRRRSQEMLERVGMGDRGHHRPGELSGGQQQRVAIARALAGNPTLILADEPSGALDTHTTAEIMQLFYELNNEEGITIVIITHDLEIADGCPRRVLLKDGVIAGEEEYKKHAKDEH